MENEKKEKKKRNYFRSKKNHPSPSSSSGNNPSTIEEKEENSSKIPSSTAISSPSLPSSSTTTTIEQEGISETSNQSQKQLKLDPTARPYAPKNQSGKSKLNQSAPSFEPKQSSTNETIQPQVKQHEQQQKEGETTTTTTQKQPSKKQPSRNQPHKQQQQQKHQHEQQKEQKNQEQEKESNQAEPQTQPQKNSSNSKSKPKPKPRPTQQQQQTKHKEEEFCILCATPLSYAAIGLCNHPVCSLCSMRLRLRSQDKNCAVCKTELNTIIIYPYRNPTDFKLFSSFGIDDDTSTVGIDVELRSRSFFIHCKNHFKDLLKMISLQCALCHQNFQSDKTLFKHVKAAHSLQFCELCFTHRPLFSCEQNLMTTTELNEHLASLPGSMIGSGGDKSGGHPLCKFCSKRFFDSQALYVHMRDIHFTCHLCPSRYQQRFYRSLNELIGHLYSTHFVCNHCVPQSINNTNNIAETSQSYSQVVNFSFARKAEFNEHMKSFHGINSTSSGTDNLSIAITASMNGLRNSGNNSNNNNGRGGNDELSSLDYIDLNMASADPYRLDNNNSSSTTAAFGALGGDTNDRSLVPPHMRVLGRVTGTGNFMPDLSFGNDEEELGENNGRGGNTRNQRDTRNNNTMTQNQSSLLSNDFPALSATTTNNNNNSQKNSSNNNTTPTFSSSITLRKG